MSVKIKSSFRSKRKNRIYSMKKGLLKFYFLVLFIFFLVGDSTAVAAETPSDYEAVKECIEQSIGWAIEKDFEAMFRL